MKYPVQKDKVRRQHFSAVLGYTTKNFWMLLIPAVRALIAYSFNILEWMHVMWEDILIIILMFAAAVFRWYFNYFTIGEKSFFHHSGFAPGMDSEIPYRMISAVTSEKALRTLPFRCTVVLVDTDSKSIEFSKKSPDIRLVMKNTDADELFKRLAEMNSGAKLFGDRIPKRSLFMFSTFFSSAFSGVMLIAAFLINSANIIGDTLERMFFDAVNTAAENVTRIMGSVIRNITPVTAGVTILLIAGWLISFLRNLFRHMNFCIEKRGTGITISDGFITKRKYYISSHHINYADIRQNLIMKAAGIMSVNVNCSGYGKGKDEIPVFIPVSSQKKISGIMRRIIPGYEVQGEPVKSGMYYIWRYIGAVTVAVMADIFISGIGIMLLPQWYDMLLFAFIMTEIPLIWLLIVKAAAYCTGSITYNGQVMAIKYCTWYEFHTVIVPRARIAKIAVSRTVFQMINGSCDVIVYTNSEYTKSHRIGGIPIKDAQMLLERYSKDI